MTRTLVDHPRIISKSAARKALHDFNHLFLSDFRISLTQAHSYLPLHCSDHTSYVYFIVSHLCMILILFMFINSNLMYDNASFSIHDV
ncbi:hypothetical protein DCAR_0104939 [Daucus carota subsp. sativus]|uniref:Uncharacterized protein n=1 Tax=Daucus carota subsp. sativus TaxID=79200 RepID=A0A166J8F0_DAUCS|nr:hypothetical protein DCAR_0104939 [Daucus carota subsp. sativus]